jgi:hypothetical protein
MVLFREPLSLPCPPVLWLYYAAAVLGLEEGHLGICGSPAAVAGAPGERVRGGGLGGGGRLVVRSELWCGRADAGTEHHGGRIWMVVMVLLLVQRR